MSHADCLDANFAFLGFTHNGGLGGSGAVVVQTQQQADAWKLPRLSGYMRRGCPIFHALVGEVGAARWSSRPSSRQAGADSGAERTYTAKGLPRTAAPSSVTATRCTPTSTHRHLAL